MGHGGEMVQVCHLGMPMIFTDMQSSAGKTSIQVSSWLPNSQRAMFSIAGNQLCRSFFLFSLAQPQAQVRMFPPLTWKGSATGSSAAAAEFWGWVLKYLGWRPGREKRNVKKGTLSIEKAGGVSPTMGCFLGSFTEQAFLFGDKKSVINTLLIVC